MIEGLCFQCKNIFVRTTNVYYRNQDHPDLNNKYPKTQSFCLITDRIKLENETIECSHYSRIKK